ncbi:hypothetical protein [Methylosinus sp. PW1]|uniref:hypothetical protein n=1 Tax=Methylosinus sp. PW1 TaxID=107636 RepID=UPI000567C575|nr:hypothetical protein [Methylosinus sp. PW1]
MSKLEKLVDRVDNAKSLKALCKALNALSIECDEQEITLDEAGVDLDYLPAFGDCEDFHDPKQFITWSATELLNYDWNLSPGEKFAVLPREDFELRD